MNDRILNLELRLLILRYGRQRIIHALARLGSQTPEVVEQELAAALERQPREAKPKAQPVAEVIAEACRNRPDITELVTLLVSRFESHTFLPQLRDVVRFLDRAGVQHGKLKSRRQSTPQVVDALVRLKDDELRQLATTPAGEGDSDFALLAREIMTGNRPRRPPKDSPD